MSTKVKLVLAAVLALGAGSLAQADEENDGGNETGGYVLPGSMSGVNPAYHPRWFPAYGNVMRAYDRANRSIYSGGGAYAYAYAPLAIQHKHRSHR
jgi:hypothetical protein